VSSSRRLVKHNLIDKHELLYNKMKKVCYLDFTKLLVLAIFNSLCLFFS